MLTCGWFSPTGVVLGKESVTTHLVLHSIDCRGRAGSEQWLLWAKAVGNRCHGAPLFQRGGRAGVDLKLLTQNVRVQACLGHTLPACPGPSSLLVFTVKNMTAYGIICLFYT